MQPRFVCSEANKREETSANIKFVDVDQLGPLLHILICTEFAFSKE